MAGSEAPSEPRLAGPERPRFDAAANRLGALALRVVDRINEGAGDSPVLSATSEAALSSLHNFLHRPTIEALSGVLGISHSGTVRLVDRLEDGGLVRRAPGDDARSTVVLLTPAGKRAAKKAAASRSAVLASALSVLTTEERGQLDVLVSRMLVGLMRAQGATGWMCRRCDTSTCGHTDGSCPVTNAARQMWGS